MGAWLFRPGCNALHEASETIITLRPIPASEPSELDSADCEKEGA